MHPVHMRQVASEDPLSALLSQSGPGRVATDSRATAPLPVAQTPVWAEDTNML